MANEVCLYFRVIFGGKRKCTVDIGQAEARVATELHHFGAGYGKRGATTGVCRGSLRIVTGEVVVEAATKLGYLETISELYLGVKHGAHGGDENIGVFRIDDLAKATTTGFGVTIAYDVGPGQARRRRNE